MNYRHSRHAGGTYFFTVNIAERKQDLLVTHVEPLRSAFRLVKQRHPFHIDAIVVLPEHLHTVWTIPKDDAKRWRLIKEPFLRA
jgi:putative transposase